MKKKYQVFVSSTFTDLLEERQAVIETLIRSECFPLCMEYFNASDQEKWEYIKGLIDESSYLLTIVGGRYGSISKKTKKSFTQMEYEYAIKKGIPTISFLHKDPNKIPIGKTDENREKLENFRKILENGPIVKYWENSHELKTEVALSIKDLIKRSPRCAWIRQEDNLSFLETKDFESIIHLGRYFDFSETNRKIIKSKTVELFGTAFAGTFPALYEEFLQKNLNTEMKIMLMDTNKHAIHCAALKNGYDIETMKNDYDNNLLKVKKMVELSNGKIQCKVIDTLPPYNLFIYNRNEPDAEIVVHLAGWKAPATDGRPIFIVSKKGNKKWFDYFLNQFEKIWVE